MKNWIHMSWQQYQVSDKTIRRDLLRMERYLPLVRAQNGLSG